MDIREKIIFASSELFLLNGIKNVTMDDVAQNLGMSKRTIYEHFDNKRSLLLACVEDYQQRKMDLEVIVVAKAANIVEELFLLMKPLPAVEQANSYRFSMELKKYFPDIFSELYTARSQIVEKRFAERLQRGVDQGIISPKIRMDIAIYVILETITSLINNTERLLANNIKVEDAFRHTFISFFRGIATPNGVKLIDEVMDLSE